MNPRSLACVGLAALGSAGAAQADTIAVTEFMRNPYSTDAAHEWVELFNYGQSDVNLNGWTVNDDGSTNIYTFGDVTLPSGGYLILAKDKGAFEGRWFQGVADDRVIGGSNLALNNGSVDEIVVTSADDEIVWTLGTAAAATDYRATFLADTDFAFTDYGNNEDPGIDSAGVDITGTLGYEDNANTLDPSVFFSTAGGGGIEYGSPLAGPYTTLVPEPASIALLAAGAVLGLRRRRHA